MTQNLTGAHMDWLNVIIMLIAVIPPLLFYIISSIIGLISYV